MSYKPWKNYNPEWVEYQKSLDKRGIVPPIKSFKRCSLCNGTGYHSTSNGKLNCYQCKGTGRVRT